MGVKRSESMGQDLCSNVSDKRMASGITGKVRGSVSQLATLRKHGARLSQALHEGGAANGQKA